MLLPHVRCALNLERTSLVAVHEADAADELRADTTTSVSCTSGHGQPGPTRPKILDRAGSGLHFRLGSGLKSEPEHRAGLGSGLLFCAFLDWSGRASRAGPGFLHVPARFGLKFQTRRSGRAGFGPNFLPLGFFKPGPKPGPARTLPRCSSVMACAFRGTVGGHHSSEVRVGVVD
jgi:hypothetical protein